MLPAVLALLLALLVLTVSGCGKEETKAAEEGPETAASGVWINNHDVSGKTYEEIAEVINQDIAVRAEERITLYANGLSVTVTAGELGLHCTDDSLAEKALAFGKSGSAIQQYKDNSYILSYGAYVIDIPYEVSEEQVRAVIQEKTPALSEGTGGSVLVHNEDGSFTVIPGENGMTVDEDPSVEKLVNYMNSEWTGGVGSTNLAVKEGDISDEVAALSMVQDLLGTFATSYDASEEERSTNIEVGTAKINGLLLYPGQSISICTLLEPFTAEEGYQSAHSYEQGLIVDSIGGGVCQISSTLYNAVLRAELQIDERVPHSMVVGYIAPSLDAAIAENTKDLIFTNNTDGPILIEGYAGGGTVAFSIYGHETRDPARSIDFESVILEEEEYTYQFELDATEEVGAYETSDPRNGVEAEAYKLTYQNGELVSRELLSRSSYRMSPMVYTIGIMGATEDEILQLSEAIATNEIDEVNKVLGRLELKYPDAKTSSEKQEEAEEAAAAAE
ncbi:MAG: VanW family protein [Lachnospiraceae bacterium]|nr:VanW family protein [Lachnospiraceae bacterium]